MGRLGTDLEEKPEPRVASLAEAQKPKRQRVMHEVTRARLDTGRDREAEAQKPKRQRVMHEVTRARLDTGRDREADPQPSPGNRSSCPCSDPDQASRKVRCRAAIWMRRRRQSGWESGVAAA